MSLASLIEEGGTQAKTGIAAPVVLKAGPGRLCRVVVQVAPTGVPIFNDCATVAAAQSSNKIPPFIPASAAVNSTYEVEWPLANGLVLSDAQGGTFAVSWI